MEMSQNNQPDLKSQILKKIEGESLCPRSRWMFSCQEFIVRLLLLLLVAVAATAVSVTIYALIYGNYALYEVTHRSFASFVFEILPYVWLVVFVAMILLAIYNVRHLKTGYRYAIWKVVGGTLLLSVVVGGLMHLLGLGFVLDQKFGRLSSYPSQEKLELRFWQNPEAGRLVVSLTESRSIHPNMVVLEDVKGGSWRTNISSLSTEDFTLLHQGKRVRVVGQRVEDDNVDFHACAVFPWVFEYNYSQRELRELREVTKNKLVNFKNRQRDLEFGRENEDLCAKLPFNSLQFR